MQLNWDVESPYIKQFVPQQTDMDGLSHTNNAVYTRWCEDMAWQHSASLGVDLKMYQELDRAMAITSANYQYLFASNAGEELLLATWLAACDGKLTCERHFQIINAATGETIFRGQWKLCCIAISSGRPKRMPKPYADAYTAAVKRETTRV